MFLSLMIILVESKNNLFISKIDLLKLAIFFYLYLFSIPKFHCTVLFFM
jgi:hypothetical protein